MNTEVGEVDAPEARRVREIRGPPADVSPLVEALDRPPEPSQSADSGAGAGAPGLEAAGLMAAIATRGDRAAFTRLFELYAPRVKGQLLARGASAALADELTQEVMLTVWRKADSFASLAEPDGIWIGRIHGAHEAA